ncbi:MAG TPA: hypothetical protein VFG73_02135 [Rhodanobacteraceae bacterium]|nr:hypothetical protein [Rhodanobacteraceae bacterium]
MTCIAWDGKVLAADKQSTDVGLRRLTVKLHRMRDGAVGAFTGNTCRGAELLDWYESGAQKRLFPPAGTSDAVLVVLDRTGVRVFEKSHLPQRVLDPFTAFGTGREYAIGAMARGASAREAVEIANRFDNCCGLGVDVMGLAD